MYVPNFVAIFVLTLRDVSLASPVRCLHLFPRFISHFSLTA